MGPGSLEESGSLNGAGERPASVRAFFALPLLDAHRQVLAGPLAGYAAQAPGFRWVTPENLHLTIRFIGRVERELAFGVAGRLAARRLSAPRLELGELGSFKRGRLVRVVWAGLRSGEADVKALASAVEAECAIAGLASEVRAFAPHLTLARSREPGGALLPTLPPMPRLDAWTAGELVLYQSHLGRQGTTYEALVRVALSRSD